MTMKYENYTVTFEAPSEAIDMYSLRFISVSGGKRFVGYYYSDHGSKVQVFAMQHLGDPATFTFTQLASTMHL
jgi:hypothetical protein